MNQHTEERFDVYDKLGNPIGTATREETHAKGLWHHTVHCWLVRRGEDGRARILFQRRSASKDTNPGGYDITAAGHLSAGETPREASRELEEELGVRIPFEKLVSYGTIREEAAGEAGGKHYIDREVSHVFGAVTELEPRQFRLQEEEVSGLYEADALRLIAMMEGLGTTVEARGVLLEGGKIKPDTVTVTASEFVSRDYGYYVGVFGFLLKLAEQPQND
ncbi:NUDIX domain-containing protein [Cohnella pontilimi]|uniref:NUDIX domain-containing protein n=1 Tax=Cohnella pontilimi TaxID=2564100 RepID=A0A4U0FC15_9BACL|nr:NUDIX domain-containing protein [Cohnella pontilimi]TJY40772.1 NUDIX domain-containing protein [Cohnella pontilimi]